MDILEQGTDEPSSPLRRRSVAVVLAVAALGIIVVRHHPSHPPTPPIAAVSSPAPTPTSESPAPTLETPAPTPPAPLPVVSPPPASLVRLSQPCDGFLRHLTLPKLDKWHAFVDTTTRVNASRTRTYKRASGHITISAGCGPIKWVLPLGMSEDTIVYVNDAVRNPSSANGGPAIEIWRAEKSVGWFRVVSDGPRNAVLNADQLDQLRLAINAGAKTV